METLFINSAQPETKHRAIAKIGALQGGWKIELKKTSGRRSTQANRYYFGVCVVAFQNYLAEQGQSLSPEQIHEFLKSIHLPVDVVNPATGEVMTIGGESRKLSVEDFSAYVLRVESWLAELGIVLPGMELAA
jgi:hypothetical protein